MPTTFNKAAYDKQYVKDHTVRKDVRLSLEHDADILEHLDKAGEPFATYVKRLIRADMKRTGE